MPKKEYAYYRSQFKTSKAKMANFMEALLLTDSTMTDSIVVGLFGLTRVKGRLSATTKIRREEKNVDRFEEISGVKLVFLYRS